MKWRQLNLKVKLRPAFFIVQNVLAMISIIWLVVTTAITVAIIPFFALLLLLGGDFQFVLSFLCSAYSDPFNIGMMFGGNLAAFYLFVFGKINGHSEERLTS
jgi:hypothetical protein